MISGEGTIFDLVRCEDEAGWLGQRARGVGGSDVAAIMGLSPWRTPAEVWLEKTGRAEPQDLSDRPNVVFGNIMEPIVADWYREHHPGVRVRRVNAVCRSRMRPWAQASLDYELLEPGKGWGVLEIKTARDRRDWKAGIPDYYMTQVVHYLSVTGRTHATVAAFFRDEADFACWRVERDERDVMAVEAAVDSFWHDFVEADVMPVLVGTSGEARGLAQMYSEPSADSVTDTGADTLQLVSDYQDAAERERAAKADKQRASTLLMAKIGDHRTLFTDTARVTWSRSECEQLDVARLRAERPDTYREYCTKRVRNGGLRVTDIK